MQLLYIFPAYITQLSDCSHFPTRNGMATLSVTYVLWPLREKCFSSHLLCSNPSGLDTVTRPVPVQQTFTAAHLHNLSHSYYYSMALQSL